MTEVKKNRLTGYLLDLHKKSKYRHGRKVPILQLGKRTGYSPSQITRVFKGENSVTKDFFIQISTKGFHMKYADAKSQWEQLMWEEAEAKFKRKDCEYMDKLMRAKMTLDARLQFDGNGCLKVFVGSLFLMKERTNEFIFKRLEEIRKEEGVENLFLSVREQVEDEEIKATTVNEFLSNFNVTQEQFRVYLMEELMKAIRSGLDFHSNEIRNIGGDDNVISLIRLPRSVLDTGINASELKSFFEKQESTLATEVEQLKEYLEIISQLKINADDQ